MPPGPVTLGNTLTPKLSSAPLGELPLIVAANFKPSGDIQAPDQA